MEEGSTEEKGWMACGACKEESKAGIDCINRAGHNDAKGTFVSKSEVPSTPTCRVEMSNCLASIGLGW
jgi:hypothetical protein